jgi:hypothetical protein
LLQTTITCLSDEGEACEDISLTPEVPGDCLINVTYSYAIEDVGREGFIIWSVNRTRAGETEELFDLLPFYTLEKGDVLTFNETEEIDRCVYNNFTTELDVQKHPQFENLCRYTTFYPNFNPYP